jgi:aminopeptidase N
MMWGTLWDSVREGELDPREYVELAIKNIGVEKDELTIQTILGRVSTAMTYYIPAADRSEPPASEGGAVAPSAGNSANDLNARLENLLIDKMRSAPTLGQRVTFYRAFLNIATTENARKVLKDMLRNGGGNLSGSEGVPSSVVTPQQTTAQRDTLPTGRVSASVASIPLKTKDRFDIVTKLAILGDPDAPELLAGLEKSETSDDAKRYAYAARAAFPTKENREKFWNDFVNNKDISESWIEAAMGPFNSPRHSELSLPYLPRALAELPNLKRSRKIFFVNGWLAAFIGGQKSQEALDIVNKFLVDNPGLDRDLRLKVLENVDVVERAVKIRRRFESRL